MTSSRGEVSQTSIAQFAHRFQISTEDLRRQLSRDNHDLWSQVDAKLDKGFAEVHALHSNTVQHTATHCNTLQFRHCNTHPTYCNTQYECGLKWMLDWIRALLRRTRCIATHNTLQHTATHCNTLQHRHSYTLQHTAIHSGFANVCKMHPQIDKTMLGEFVYTYMLGEMCMYIRLFQYFRTHTYVCACFSLLN